MQLDVVNNENQKIGSVDVSDAVFGGRVNRDVMWESVVHANAAERRLDINRGVGQVLETSTART